MEICTPSTVGCSATPGPYGSTSRSCTRRTATPVRSARGNGRTCAGWSRGRSPTGGRSSTTSPAVPAARCGCCTGWYGRRTATIRLPRCSTVPGRRGSSRSGTRSPNPARYPNRPLWTVRRSSPYCVCCSTSPTKYGTARSPSPPGCCRMPGPDYWSWRITAIPRRCDICGRAGTRATRSPSAAPSLAGTSPAVATHSGPFQAGPVVPPANGALLGAWVKPAAFGQPARIEAVNSFEAALGRPLDLVNTYRRFDEAFPAQSDFAFADAGRTVMLSWAIDDTRVLTSGVQDAAVRAWARHVRDFGHPILLRFRWEMDRPNLQAGMWSAADYIEAWKHVRTIFDAERVRNVSWVWCPTVEGFAGGYAPAYYPGDDQVDWTRVDAYSGRQLRPLD